MSYALDILTCGEWPHQNRKNYSQRMRSRHEKKSIRSQPKRTRRSGGCFDETEIISLDGSDSTDDRHFKGTRRSRGSIDEPDIILSANYDSCDGGHYKKPANKKKQKTKPKRTRRSRGFIDEPEIVSSDEYDSCDGGHYKKKLRRKKLIRECGSPLKSTKCQPINYSTNDDKNGIANQSLCPGHVLLYDRQKKNIEHSLFNDSESSSENESEELNEKHHGKKKNANKKDSSDEWEMQLSDNDTSSTSTSSSTSTTSFDSGSDYEVESKRRYQKYKKPAMKKKGKTEPKIPPVLSEYEKMIQKNKEEQMAFLASLKMDEVKEDLKEAVKGSKSKTVKPRKEHDEKVLEVEGRPMVSASKNSEENHHVKKKTTNKRDSSDEGEMHRNDDYTSSTSTTSFNPSSDHAKPTSKEKEKTKPKVHRQSSRLKELPKKRVVNYGLRQSARQKKRTLNSDQDILSFDEALIKDSVYNDFINEFNEPEFKIPQLHDNEYVSHFEKMKFQESLNVTSSVISSMVVHESQEKIILCAGSFNGEIILWHVNSKSEVCAFQPHFENVNCLKFNPHSPNVLISASTDGIMFHGDFEKQVFNQIFKAESCNYFDFLSPTAYLVAHGNGYVSIVDIRSNRKYFQKRHNCDSFVVKTVDLHPVNKNYFISAHQKGMVKLWDLRKLQNQPVDNVYFDGGNMISSFFSGVTGNSVLVTLSNAICRLDSSSLDKELHLNESIEHENVWESTSFQAKWLPNTDDAFVVGSNLNPRRIEIFDKKLCNLFSFTDEQFNHITPVNIFHSSLPFLASASKGKIFIFSETE